MFKGLVIGGWSSSVGSLGLKFRVSGFRFRMSGFRCRVSGVGFRVSGFGFRVSGFGCRVSGFGFRVSGFGIAYREEVDADDGLEKGALSTPLRSYHCDL